MSRLCFTLLIIIVYDAPVPSNGTAPGADSLNLSKNIPALQGEQEPGGILVFWPCVRFRSLLKTCTKQGAPKRPPRSGAKGAVRFHGASRTASPARISTECIFSQRYHNWALDVVYQKIFTVSIPSGDFFGRENDLPKGPPLRKGAAAYDNPAFSPGPRENSAGREPRMPLRGEKPRAMLRTGPLRNLQKIHSQSIDM